MAQIVKAVVPGGSAEHAGVTVGMVLKSVQGRSSNLCFNPRAVAAT